jgi:hypothetical protein
LLYEAGSVVHSKKDTKFSSKGVQKRAQHTWASVLYVQSVYSA